MTIEEQLDDLTAKLAVMAEDMAFIKEQIVKSAETIDKVGKEVMPTIDELMKSPMLKMLGVGKKK
jgi:Ni,Fe-hydrogenase I large subunit